MLSVTTEPPVKFMKRIYVAALDAALVEGWNPCVRNNKLMVLDSSPTGLQTYVWKNV